MKDFIAAAIPWVLCALAVAIVCVRLGGSKERRSKQLDNNLAIGLALGLMLSPALNSMGLWENHGIGFALGPLWGMALASLYQKQDDKKEE